MKTTFIERCGKNSSELYQITSVQLLESEPTSKCSVSVTTAYNASVFIRTELVKNDALKLYNAIKQALLREDTSYIRIDVIAGTYHIYQKDEVRISYLVEESSH